MKFKRFFAFLNCGNFFDMDTTILINYANGEANRVLYDALFFAEKTLEPLYIIFTLFT